MLPREDAHKMMKYMSHAYAPRCATRQTAGQAAHHARSAARCGVDIDTIFVMFESGAAQRSAP